MTIKIRPLLFFSAVFLSFQLQAQQLLVLNGGKFGSNADIANLGVFTPSNDNYITIDSIGNTSVQDLLIEDDRYAYVAAADSIVKYDLLSGERLAAAAFGGISTAHLGIYNDRLLVGNYYGATSSNLHILDKNTLAFIDTIPEITKGAKDFLVIGDYAYIPQNSGFPDTLGYLAVVDLSTNSFLRNDTLSSNGDDLGRLVNVGDSAIYSLNSVSNTISSYNISTGQTNTVSTNINIQVETVGGTVYHDGNTWYFPYDGGIGTYDIVNNTVESSNIVPVSDEFSFAVDTQDNKIFITQIDFTTQVNYGYEYNTNGDSLGTFPVGFSPEVLEIWYSNTIVSTEKTEEHTTFGLNIFPNPATAYFQLENFDAIQSVTILDVNGRSIKSWQNPIYNQFELDNLPNGSYVVVVRQENQVLSKVLIKK